MYKLYIYISIYIRYAILEIKLQDVSEAPLWLRQTLNDIGAAPT